MNNQMPDKVNIRDANGNITTISYSELKNHEEMIIEDNIFHAVKTGDYTDEEIKDYEKQAKEEWKNLKQQLSENHKLLLTLDKATERYVPCCGKGNALMERIIETENVYIYKDHTEAVIIQAIERHTTETAKQLEELIKDSSDILRTLAAISASNEAYEDENKENTYNAVIKRLDSIPWFLQKENGLLYSISKCLVIWIYPQCRHAGHTKKYSALLTISFMQTIYNTITADEWIKIIQKCDNSSVVDYYYVKENIKTPVINKDEIKAKIQEFLNNHYIDADVDDVEEAYSNTFNNPDNLDGTSDNFLMCFCQSGWGWHTRSLDNDIDEFLQEIAFKKIIETNSEFDNDENYDNLTDCANDITGEVVSDMMDAITPEEWKQMIITAIQANAE